MGDTATIIVMREVYLGKLQDNPFFLSVKIFIVGRLSKTITVCAFPNKSYSFNTLS
jgi:hypothetical protein